MYYWKKTIGVSVGNKLRDLRLKSGRTLKEQGEFLGVNNNSVYRWEHNLSIPREEVLKKISEIYGVSLEWLLSDTDRGTQLKHTYASTSDSETDDTEQQLLWLYRKLLDNSKNKIIGYVLRIFVEDMDR